MKININLNKNFNYDIEMKMVMDTLINYSSTARDFPAYL